MSARDLPYGAAEIIALRSSGKRPADLVLVSFLGPLRESNPVIIAKAERAYDWRVLVGLSVAVIIESNTPNLAGIVKAIVAAKPGSLSVWFADRQDGVNVSLNGYRPATKVGAAWTSASALHGLGSAPTSRQANAARLIARQAKCRAMVNADRFDAALVEMAQAGFRRIFGKAWEAA